VLLQWVMWNGVWMELWLVWIKMAVPNRVY